MKIPYFVSFTKLLWPIHTLPNLPEKVNGNADQENRKEDQQVPVEVVSLRYGKLELFDHGTTCWPVKLKGGLPVYWNGTCGVLGPSPIEFTADTPM